MKKERVDRGTPDTLFITAMATAGGRKEIKFAERREKYGAHRA